MIEKYFHEKYTEMLMDKSTLFIHKAAAIVGAKKNKTPADVTLARASVREKGIEKKERERKEIGSMSACNTSERETGDDGDESEREREGKRVRKTYI